MVTKTAVDYDTAHKMLQCCREAYYMFSHNAEIREIPKGYRLVRHLRGTALGKEFWYGLVLESDDDIIVAFRGSQSDEDWLMDADILQTSFPYIHDGGLVHNGFLSIYHSLRDELVNTITDLDTEKEIFVTGHSLGGALATLFILDIANVLRNLKQTLITFASPKIGNKKFVERFNIIILDSYRFVNLNDVVPTFPPQLIHAKSLKTKLQYMHTPHPLSFSIDEGGLYKNHRLETYKKGIEKMFYK